MSVDAILLAGGRGSRVDGAVKPMFEVGGGTLLGAAVAAVRTHGARRIVVAATVLDPSLDVEWVREDPPFGGPVAGIVAALESVDADEAYVLACDLVHAAPAVALLSEPLPPGLDGACLDDGRRQWLVGRYRTAALRAAASALPEAGRDASTRALLGGLEIRAIRADADVTRDIDTWDDLTAAGGRAPASPEEEP